MLPRNHRPVNRNLGSPGLVRSERTASRLGTRALHPWQIVVTQITASVTRGCGGWEDDV
jgi:hypothetical protein